MDRSGSSPWRLLLQLAATLVVTVFILRQVGVSWEAATTLNPERWRPEPVWILASVVTLVLGYFVSGVLWGWMVTDLGGPVLGPLRAVGIYMTANLGRYIPGKVWQILGLAALARGASVAPAQAAGAAVLGQITALAGAALVGSVAFWTYPGGTGTPVAIAVIASILTLTVFPGLFRRVVELAGRVAGRELPMELPRDPWFGVRWVLLYALNWVIYAGAFWLLSRSFLLPGSPVQVGSAFAAAYVLGYLAVFAPAGIGVREGFLVAFLEPIMGGRAVGLAVVARLWTTLVELATAGWFGVGELRERKRGDSRE